MGKEKNSSQTIILSALGSSCRLLGPETNLREERGCVLLSLWDMECGSHIFLSSQLSKRSKWILTQELRDQITHHQQPSEILKPSEELEHLNELVNFFHCPKQRWRLRSKYSIRKALEILQVLTSLYDQHGQLSRSGEKRLISFGVESQLCPCKSVPTTAGS